MKNFTSLGLPTEILQAVEELNFTQPSEIQEKSIPILINGETDFLGLAQTGTGKTAAFGLPLLTLIDAKISQTQALVLAPTRELGQQIAQQLELFSKYQPNISIVCVYGGASITDQIKKLRKTPQVIIATPGRLIDLVKRKAIQLQNLRYLILDEADEMLNMGFKEEIDEILKTCPTEKNTWLFSATMPNEIKHIAAKYMNNPKEVRVNTNQKVNENITHAYVVVKSSDKTMALKRFLDASPDMMGIVFCRTKAHAQELAEELMQGHYPVEALHGDLSQAQRDKVMKAFKAHHVKVLIATDVAARGIDVNNLTHIIHFAMPDDPAFYTHRSGRTARAGKKGLSLILASSSEVSKLKRLESELKIKFQLMKVPAVEQILENIMKFWAERILHHKPKKNINPEVLNEVVAMLSSMDKNELIYHLASMEMEKAHRHTDRDLNTTPGRGSRDEDRGGRERNRRDRDRNERRDRGDKRERGERRERTREKKRNLQSAPGMEKFFMNIGEMDHVSKGELVDFISETAGISRKAIGQIVINQKFTLFEVEAEKAKNLSQKFKGIEIEGRQLRVNKEG